jgi:hypothetical protein
MFNFDSSVSLQLLNQDKFDIAKLLPNPLHAAKTLNENYSPDLLMFWLVCVPLVIKQNVLASIEGSFVMFSPSSRSTKADETFLQPPTLIGCISHFGSFCHFGCFSRFMLIYYYVT